MVLPAEALPRQAAVVEGKLFPNFSIASCALADNSLSLLHEWDIARGTLPAALSDEKLKLSSYC